MKATELIEKLQAEVAANGDKEVIIAANRHSYKNLLVVSREGQVVLSLFDKVDD